MNKIINQKVNHKVYGPGVIRKYTVRPNDSDMISVYFENTDGSSKFRYPDAFEEYLTAIDPEFAIQVERDLRPSRYKNTAKDRNTNAQTATDKTKEQNAFDAKKNKSQEKNEIHKNQPEKNGKAEKRETFSEKFNRKKDTWHSANDFNKPHRNKRRIGIIAATVLALILLISGLSAGTGLQTNSVLGMTFKVDTINDDTVDNERYLEFYGDNQFVSTEHITNGSLKTEKGNYSIKNGILTLDYQSGAKEKFEITKDGNDAISLKNQATNEQAHYSAISTGMPYSDEKAKEALIGKWKDCINITDVRHPEQVSCYLEFSENGAGTACYYKFCERYSDGKQIPITYDVSNQKLTIKTDERLLYDATIQFNEGGEILSFDPEGDAAACTLSKTDTVDTAKLIIPDFYQELSGNWECSKTLKTSVYDGNFGFLLCLIPSSKTFIAQYSTTNNSAGNTAFSGKYEISGKEIALYDSNDNIYGKYSWDKVSDVLTLNQTDGLINGSTWELKQSSTSVPENDIIDGAGVVQSALLSANVLGEAETGTKSSSEKAAEAEAEASAKKAQQQQSTYSGSGGKYVGSSQSDRYHLPGCKYVKQIKSKNLIYFSSIEQAESRGYSPCKYCHPN